MDHAKFCPATQGRSTPESCSGVVLLRRRIAVEQQADHGARGGATALPVAGAGARAGLTDLV
jgi:hypothetical protein